MSSVLHKESGWVGGSGVYKKGGTADRLPNSAGRERLPEAMAIRMGASSPTGGAPEGGPADARRRRALAPHGLPVLVMGRWLSQPGDRGLVCGHDPERRGPGIKLAQLWGPGAGLHSAWSPVPAPHPESGGQCRLSVRSFSFRPRVRVGLHRGGLRHQRRSGNIARSTAPSTGAAARLACVVPDRVPRAARGGAGS
jgi:hypothetical protein